MSRVQRLTAVLVLNLALVAGLVVVGIGAHSLSVLAEGGDYLLDAAGAGPGPAGDPAVQRVEQSVGDATRALSAAQVRDIIAALIAW